MHFFCQHAHSSENQAKQRTYLVQCTTFEHASKNRSFKSQGRIGFEDEVILVISQMTCANADMCLRVLS